MQINKGLTMKTSDAVEYFGSKANLAKELGVHRSAITLWGLEIPMNRQYQIQVLTKNKLKAEPRAQPKAA